ncbi:MAG: hypothetical protein Q7S22_08685, partial [Candidatus Micrarchaeota archaeon]|nr:hypothetical protein [Candidatus Micrarchaeota archaeon]
IRPPQPKGCGFIRAEGQSCVNSALPPKVKTMSFRAELTHEVFALLKTVKFTERMQYELIPLVYIHGNKEHIDELLVGDLICDEAKKWIDTKLPSYLILCDILDGTKFYETAMAKQEAT